MQNLIAIRVRFLGPTNTKGSRVKLEVPRFEVSKTISYYRYNVKGEADNAIAWLKEQGIELLGECEDKNGESILVASFNYADKILKAFEKVAVK